MVSPGSPRDQRSAREVLPTLLLAVFVIVVTAFVATVVLDMGQTARGDQLAGAKVEFDAAADAVHVSFTSMNRPETTLDITVRNASTDGTVATARLSRVGQTYTFDNLDDGDRYRVVVVAEWRDSQSVTAVHTDRL